MHTSTRLVPLTPTASWNGGTIGGSGDEPTSVASLTTLCSASVATWLDAITAARDSAAAARDRGDAAAAAAVKAHQTSMESAFATLSLLPSATVSDVASTCSFRVLESMLRWPEWPKPYVRHLRCFLSAAMTIDEEEHRRVCRDWAAAKGVSPGAGFADVAIECGLDLVGAGAGAGAGAWAGAGAGAGTRAGTGVGGVGGALLETSGDVYPNDTSLLVDVFASRDTFVSAVRAAARERWEDESRVYQCFTPFPGGKEYPGLVVETGRPDLCVPALCPISWCDSIIESLPEGDTSGVFAAPEDGESAIVSPSVFRTHWGEFTKETFAKMTRADWSNVVAAGGAVSACLLPIPDGWMSRSYPSGPKRLAEYFHNTAYVSSDVDLFIYGLDAKQVPPVLPLRRASQPRFTFMNGTGDPQG